MAEKATAKVALDKINAKLECSICMESFTDPKLLPCFHVFCRKCLEPLVIQDRNSLSLQCPVCRHSIQLPPKGVSGLQSDFHVDHLFEIRDALEKANQAGSQTTKCEKCEVDSATGFCRDCGEFICDKCKDIHKTWKELKMHEIVSIKEVQTKAASLIRPTKQESCCPRHPGNTLKIFCETCSELICIDCTIGLHLRPEHCYHLVSDVFPKHKDEITASLEPVKQQLSAVSIALRALEGRVKEIEDQRVAIEAAVHKEINLLQQTLEQRRTELISKLDHLTQLKLKNLAAQRDQAELVQVKLSSCVDYVEGGLKTGSEGEVLAMKAPVLKRTQQITADFNPTSMQPEEEANLEVTANNKQDIQQACRQYVDIDLPIGKINPENSYAQGQGLECAIVGEKAVVVVTVVNTNRSVYPLPANLTAEVVHFKSRSTVQCHLQQEQDGRHKITYQPTHRGKHELHVKINGTEIHCSPYTIAAVTSSPLSLGQPKRTVGLGSQSKPRFVTTNSRNQIIVVEPRYHRVSMFSPEGMKLHSFGTKGMAEGEFNVPRGVCVDNYDNIYIVDNNNHRIQKFTSDGKFIKSVGTFGSSKLQFSYPLGVGFHPTNHKLYICDQKNDRVQVLSTDLTFHSIIGHRSMGTVAGNGEFNKTFGITFNCNGDILVVDGCNERVQMFSEEGKFLRVFANKNVGLKPLKNPYDVAVDSNNMVYVSESDCISVFTASGEYLTTFGGEPNMRQFDCPRGLHFDKHDFLLVGDRDNDRIQIF